MQVQEKFNSRSAKLIEVHPPHVSSNPTWASPVKVRFFNKDTESHKEIHMQMTPDEAINFASRLITAAQNAKKAAWV